MAVELGYELRIGVLKIYVDTREMILVYKPGEWTSEPSAVHMEAEKLFLSSRR